MWSMQSRWNMATGHGGGRGFVPGKHMMELSLEELNQALPGFLREWLSDFISTHDL